MRCGLDLRSAIVILSSKCQHQLSTDNAVIIFCVDVLACHWWVVIDLSVRVHEDCRLQLKVCFAFYCRLQDSCILGRIYYRTNPSYGLKTAAVPKFIVAWMCNSSRIQEKTAASQQELSNHNLIVAPCETNRAKSQPRREEKPITMQSQVVIAAQQWD